MQLEAEMNLSIIIPVYNAENYICQCLDSILKNNLTEGVEVICVNDGSTDSSLQLLYQYVNKNQLPPPDFKDN